MKKIAALICAMLFLSACGPEEVNTQIPIEPVHTATPKIVVTTTPSPTVVPLTETGQPQVVDVPGFNPKKPYRFGEKEAFIDLESGTAVNMWSDYCPETGGVQITCSSSFTPVIFRQESTEEEPKPAVEFLPPDKMNALFYRLKSNMGTYLRGMFVMQTHAGSWLGRPHPANWISFQMECGWGLPCNDLREANMARYLGQEVHLKQEEADLLFTVSSITLVEGGEWLKECEKHKDDNNAYARCAWWNNSNLDRFYSAPLEAGKVEIFMIFCGGEGNLFDLFSLRYIVRLTLK